MSRKYDADICHHRASLDRLKRYVELLTGGKGTVEMADGVPVVKVPSEMRARAAVSLAITFPTAMVSDG